MAAIAFAREIGPEAAEAWREHRHDDRSWAVAPPGCVGAPPWQADAGREYPDSLALRDLLSKPGDQFYYTYDFGDDWEHDIDLEDIIQNDLGDTLPACLDGSGACPPEDCGGPWRYAELKEILADPDHEEHEDMLDWLGLESGYGLDPVRFSVDEVNSRLSQLQGMSDFAVAAGPVPEVVRIQRRAKKAKAKRRR